MSIFSINNSADINNINPFNNIKAQEEDPDASQELWGNDELFFPDNDYDPYETLQAWVESRSCRAVEGYLQKQSFVKKINVFRSFKHITLPEALLYISVLTNSMKKGKYKAVLMPDSSLDAPKIMGFTLKIYFKKDCVKHISFGYDFRWPSVKIFENDNMVGYINYVIRGRKCEEIVGKYKQKELCLDPVFKARTKKDLKYEHFTYGEIKTTLIYNNNTKYGSLANKQQQESIKIKHKNLRISSSKALITKHLMMENKKFAAQLLFEKNILMPTFGIWKFQIS